MDDAKEAWGQGKFTAPEPTLEAVAVVNIAAVEKVKTLRSVIQLEYDEYKGLMEEMRHDQ